jgi:hemolysin D
MAEPAKSSNAVVPFPDKRVRRRDHELAFLPAALEIVETPASPIGRAIGATIIMVFVLASAWACLGTVDIVATASGKIIPSGRSKVIQPFEIGVVRAIHVHDGDTVKAGDVLIELDPTISAAEREHLQSDLIAAQLDVARCTQPWPTAPTRSPTSTRRRGRALRWSRASAST